MVFTNDRSGFVSRSKVDYIVMLAVLACMIAVGEKLWPQRTTASDLQTLAEFTDPFEVEVRVRQLMPPDADPKLAKVAMWLAAYLVVVGSINFTLWSMFIFFRLWNPDKTPIGDSLRQQVPAILINTLLLGGMQVAYDCFFHSAGLTKVTFSGLDSWLTIVRDFLLWIFCFEWGWYFQHRAMHDFKFLWRWDAAEKLVGRYGHSYHHMFRRPEQMLGVTDLAIDHVVEMTGTMTSAAIAFLIFPINFYVGKAAGFTYLVLTILGHWEGYTLSRHHINHHYFVTKNYGANFPIFDLLFGTYQYSKEYPGAKAIAKNQEDAGFVSDVPAGEFTKNGEEGTSKKSAPGRSSTPSKGRASSTPRRSASARKR